ncbi:MAG: ribosome biogenesis factor YjgA [Acidobacteriota bacterium]
MEEDRKSKSQVKREMLALQAMGKQLVELSPDQISKIEMPEDLREAVLFAKTIRKGEAIRRQIQYIGALMRDADPEPIRRALDEIGRGRNVDERRLHELEDWRDGLVEGNEAIMEEILERFPEADRQRMRQLALNAARERAANKPPKAYRELFRYLRSLTAETDSQED